MPHPGVGTIGWLDLTVPDAERVRDFYSRVVVWQVTPVEMGGYADYAVGPPGADPVAGVCHARGVNVGLPPCWLAYVIVGDLDASLREVERLGGLIVAPPRSAGGGRMAVVRDPSGAAIALMQMGTAHA